MKTQFTFDLCVARRQAGLTQSDLAHLLAIHQSGISDLEQGQTRPDLMQIVMLCLIYGRSFESLFAEIMAEARTDLLARLDTLPPLTKETAKTFNRDSSLARLRERLITDTDHGSA